jgi:hypothetical protein
MGKKRGRQGHGEEWWHYFAISFEVTKDQARSGPSAPGEPALPSPTENSFDVSCWGFFAPTQRTCAGLAGLEIPGCKPGIDEFTHPQRP